MSDQPDDEQLDRFELGRSMADQLNNFHITAQQWQDTNRSVSDYRVTDLITHLRRASTAARLLAEDDHSEEWKNALAAFQARIGDELDVESGLEAITGPTGTKTEA